MLNETQLEILKSSALAYSDEELALLQKLSSTSDCSSVSEDQLLVLLQLANLLYRAGEPVISDAIYDRVLHSELNKRNPQHPWLHKVEPEPAFTGKTVSLPVKMLSTEKAYSLEGIQKWINRIEKAASELDLEFSELPFKMTPKLDGYAAYDDGDILYTRGDGRKGTDISRVFARGLQVGGDGKRGQGAGEIVVKQSYFSAVLAEHFENARNFQASIIKEKELDEFALQAIENQAALFYPFAQLPYKILTAAQMIADFDTYIEQVLGMVDFDVDGVVIEIDHPPLQTYMGATRHHHRWQIAFKHNLETAEVLVQEVRPQTSRSGRVNPVLDLESVKLSGALISRATAHHYGMVKEQQIGPGTLIELTRSGLVIPKLERVINATGAQIPKSCPSCGTELVWESDYLFCPNAQTCPAQIENTMEHFFKTLANVDGFGGKTIQKLHQQGINSVYDIYQLDMQRLIAMGFGEKTSQNLLDQLQRSKTEAIEDWRFLGAFGIYRMGLGNCERLLQHVELQDIFSMSIADICAVEGFAEKTARVVVAGLERINEAFAQLYALNFNLVPTPLIVSQESQIDSPVAGKAIVFTGSMQLGSRDDMKKQAKQLGAKVSASVTGKTDYLVTGEKVGAAKIKAAQEKGVKILSEQEYLDMLL